ncbi:MAG: hypothetical protein ABEH38_00295 [Flavobacteriales bacterium]
MTLLLDPLRSYAPLFLIAFLLVACGGSKKEDTAKEDPVKTSSQDTVSSTKKEKADPITAAEFANAVRKRIVERAKKNGGFLKFPDPRGKDSIKVELQKVVEKSVRKAGKEVRLVCGKFKGVENGKDYDIDFFMEGDKPSNLKRSRKPLFHKVEGEPEHTYIKNEDGTVQPKKVKEKGKKGSPSKSS